MKNPIVAIIGRPNVGKSSILNRIIGYKKAIEIIKESNIIIFMADVRDGITPHDRLLSKELRKSEKPILFAVNKVDNAKLELDISDFYSLGFEPLYPISALHGIGINTLLDEIINHLPQEASKKESINYDTAVSIIGKPNVGKSSLLNAIIGKEKAIVDEKAGTTRDTIDILYKYQNINYLLIDTAGLRKKSKIHENIEHYSILRALKAIQRSDIVILVLDANDPWTEQDKKIADICLKEGKSCIIAVNKWDLIEKDDKTIYAYEEAIRQRLWFLDFAPLIFISALTKKRVFDLFDIISEVDLERQKKIPTRTLTNTLHYIQKLRPAPLIKSKRLSITYATQTGISPPVFTLFVNNPSLLTQTYEKYLINSLRDNLGQFLGTPIKLILRRK